MDPKKGIHILPSLFTTGNVFCGFYAFVAVFNEQFYYAAWAIAVGMIFDGLDGRIARLTKTTSAFGEQYDSLADIITFGMAPAFLAYAWVLKPFGRLGWMAAFLFLLCAALRLARFNTQAGTQDKSYFQGLASPAAAGTLVATIWFFADQGISGESVRWLMWLETVALGLLMFSRVRYFSGKTWPTGDRIPTGFLFLVVLVFVLLAIDPPTVLMVIGIVYVGSGLIMTLLGRQQWKSRRSRRQLKKIDSAVQEDSEREK